MNLEENDYKILCCLFKHPDLPVENISKNCKIDMKTLEYRLYNLTKATQQRFTPIGTLPMTGSNYVNYDRNNKTYCLSTYGLKTVEDYQNSLKIKRIDFFKNSVLAPIIVSLITTLITLWLSK